MLVERVGGYLARNEVLLDQVDDGVGDAFREGVWNSLDGVGLVEGRLFLGPGAVGVSWVRHDIVRFGTRAEAMFVWE